MAAPEHVTESERLADQRCCARSREQVQASILEIRKAGDRLWQLCEHAADIMEFNQLHTVAKKLKRDEPLAVPVQRVLRELGIEPLPPTVVAEREPGDDPD